MTGNTDQADFLFGVENSLMGRAWMVRPFDMREALAISQRFDLPEIVGRLLAARGQTIDTTETFLNPSIKECMPDPSVMRDMDKAADILSDAVLNDQTIAIFGDYDVDGATSTSLLITYLGHLGVKTLYYIPDRQKEGYGPNSAAFQSLKQQGADVIITVDCGIMSFEPVQTAKDLGLKVIIVDHHKAETDLPVADAIVNPNRLDDNSGLGMLAAVGVTFMLIVALNRSLRQKDRFNKNTQAPNILKLLDVVALGTVCDVVPLKGLNRVFVKQGLKQLALRQNIGLTALSDQAGLDQKPTPYHLGFVLGPRINAGGRVGKASMGTDLLVNNQPETAMQLAVQLANFNDERKEIEAGVENDALSSIFDEVGMGNAPWPAVMILGEGWHSGVIGIVASRLKDRFNRPTLVCSEDQEGVIKGSARSITGVDIGAIILEARHKGLIEAGGGHAMAAGVTLNRQQYEGFKAFFMTKIEDAVALALKEQVTHVDGLLTISGITGELIDQIDELEPFGVGNPGPKFAIANCKVSKADIIGGNHVRVFLEGPEGGRIKAMAFRSADSDLGSTLLANQGKKFHVIGKIKRDTWMGRDGVEMTIDDAVLLS